MSQTRRGVHWTPALMILFAYSYNFWCDEKCVFKFARNACNRVQCTRTGEHGSPLRASNDRPYWINCKNLYNVTLGHNMFLILRPTSMNKNNIRNGHGKPKRRIVRFKYKICEIKNISSEIQIIRFVQYAAKFVRKHTYLAVIGRNVGWLLLFDCSILIKITDMWNKNMYMC